jgi:hypothetical protein
MSALGRESGKEKRGKDRDDGNDDQQLDERERQMVGTAGLQAPTGPLRERSGSGP